MCKLLVHSVFMNLLLLTNLLLVSLIYSVILFVPYHLIDVLDGYAFSQEEHGIITQVVSVSIFIASLYFELSDLYNVCDKCVSTEPYITLTTLSRHALVSLTANVFRCK